MLEALARVMPEVDAEDAGIGTASRPSWPGLSGPPVEARAPGGDADKNRRERALAALSTMVGAVVLARMADDPELAQAFLDAAAASILTGRENTPG
jgi:hypothetical protein